MASHRSSPHKAALLDWDNSLRAGWIIRDWTQRLVEDACVPLQTLATIDDAIRRHAAGLMTYEAFANEAPAALAAGLRDVAVERIQGHAREFVRDDPVGLRHFAEPLLRALRSRSIVAVVVSGAPQEILQASLLRYRLDKVYGTTLTHHEGRYSGVVHVNRALAIEKQRVVDELSRAATSFALCVGDSASDLPLLRVGELAVVIDDADLAAELPNGMLLDSNSNDIGPLLRRLDR